MANNRISASHKQESTGQDFTEAKYLDAHFEAYRADYEYMIRAVQLQPQWTVLDAGSGSGSYLPYIANIIGENGTIYALDHATENIEQISQRIQQDGFSCSVDVRLGSITELPYPDNSVDAVWCANVVQYLNEAQFEQAILEFRRVVRPGGLVAIKEFDVTGLYIAPVSPDEWWKVLSAHNTRGGNGISAAMRTLSMPQKLAKIGFESIRYESVVSECRPPLTEAQLTYFGTIIPFWYEMALQSMLSAEELESWRSFFGDREGPHHILNSENFYHREVHGLLLGTVPEDS